MMLSRADIRGLLTVRGAAQDELFAESRRVRDAHFGPTAVLRGVIEVTNVCRVNCEYCPMRRDNVASNDTYFLTVDQILVAAEAIRRAGVDVVLLQGGETPALLPTLMAAMPRIREMYDGEVEILLNLGNLRRHEYQKLYDAGATSYILKHETSDPVLHQQIRRTSLSERLRAFRDLREIGFRTGTGLISSLPGQTLDSVVDDIELAGELGADMCSVSPFIPAPDTPMAIHPIGDMELALNVIACLRLAHPHLLVPSVSALERTTVGGQSRGLHAGANVMTVNFSRAAEQQRYLIYGKDRFVVTLDHVSRITAASGMTLRGSVFLDDHVAVTP